MSWDILARGDLEVLAGVPEIPLRVFGEVRPDLEGLDDDILGHRFWKPCAVREFAPLEAFIVSGSGLNI